MKTLPFFLLLVLALGARAQALPGTGTWAVTEATYNTRKDAVIAQRGVWVATVTAATRNRVAYTPAEVQPPLHLAIVRLSANSVEMANCVWYADYADGVYHFSRTLVGAPDLVHIQTWQRVFGPQYATSTLHSHEND